MKRPRVTDVVLVLLCLMYFVTYLDRVNVSSAAADFPTTLVSIKPRSVWCSPLLRIPTWYFK